jgi:hypothetical protein
MDNIKEKFDIEEQLGKLEYIGNFFIKNNSPNLIGFNYSSTKEILSNKNGRIYFFVEINDENKKFLKIGKSSTKTGIKGTLSFYYDALSGTPGQNRFCMHYMIREKLDLGSKVEVYAIFSKSILTEINSFKTSLKIEVPLDMTYVEKLYLDDYKNNFGKYPEWNFQENNQKLPNNLMENFGKFIINKKTKK